MNLEDILTPDRCFCRLEGVSKKRLLTNASQLIADTVGELESDEIYHALMAREHLGSTGLGNGIAIPHCRVTGIDEIIGAMITLQEPIDFDAIDQQPVDLLFVLIVPEQENDSHVKTLAGLAEMFSDEDFCFTLRQTHDREDLYNVAIMY